MRRCPHCQSIWVVWNWVSPSSGSDEWIHECHNCSAAFPTHGPVDDGAVYEVVTDLGEFFVEPGRFERQMAADMEFIQKEWGAKQ